MSYKGGTSSDDKSKVYNNKHQDDRTSAAVTPSKSNEQKFNLFNKSPSQVPKSPARGSSLVSNVLGPLRTVSQAKTPMKLNGPIRSPAAALRSTGHSIHDIINSIGQKKTDSQKSASQSGSLSVQPSNPTSTVTKPSQPTNQATPNKADRQPEVRDVQTSPSSVANNNNNKSLNSDEQDKPLDLHKPKTVHVS